MSELTIFSLFWLKEKEKNRNQFMLIFIINRVGNQMSMHDVKKMHEISVSSNKVCHQTMCMWNVPHFRQREMSKRVFEN